MKRQEFIDKYRHELGGMVLDAAIGTKTGADLSLWLRGVYGRIDKILGDAHSELTVVKPPDPPPAPAKGSK